MSTLDPEVIAPGWHYRWPRTAFKIITDRPLLWTGCTLTPYVLGTLWPAYSLVPIVFGWIWLTVCFELASLEKGAAKAADIYSACKDGVWRGLRDMWESRTIILFFILAVLAIAAIVGKVPPTPDLAGLDESARKVPSPLAAWLLTRQSSAYANYQLLPMMVLLFHEFLPFVYYGIRSQLADTPKSAEMLSHRVKVKNFLPCIALEALMLAMSFFCGTVIPALLPAALAVCAVIGWVAFNELFPGNGRALKVQAVETSLVVRAS